MRLCQAISSKHQQDPPLRAMSIFLHKVNVITGKTEWQEAHEDYDYHQEIVCSAYADMLHDTERNVKYQEALESAISVLHQKGKPAHVLDIGTGTGLLSMMAARAGADSIVACEAFEPMAKSAKDIIKQNGFEKRIKVVSKRSTELTVGLNGDLPHKANILVTEVFDTELIGEGAYATFSHAHEHLLEKERIVVPSSATVYAQVVDSEFVSRWNKLCSIFDSNGKCLVDTPPEIVNCAGAAAVHDIQLSQLPLNCFKTIISPEAVFRFDWSGKTPLVKNQSTVQVLESQADGTAEAVFMWWDLVMDVEGKVLLSCAPFWAHPSKPKSSLDIPWRDHWMQAVYYLPKSVSVKQGQELTLISSHDEYSLWFNLGLDLKVKEEDYKRPVCTCGAHAALSRSRIGQLNDEHRTQKILKVLKPHINESTVCLSLSDTSLIPLALAQLGCYKVYCIESNILSRKVLENYILFNNLSDKVILIDECSSSDNFPEVITEKVDVVFSEPYHMSSILPWDNIRFWYMKSQMQHALKENYLTVPLRGIIYGMAVEFIDLWKIRAPLVEVQGFGMKPFDDLIEKSNELVDAGWEPQPLWEYPCRALSLPCELMELKFGSSLPKNLLQNSGALKVIGNGKCNGVALWIDWDLDGSAEHMLSSGPTITPQVDQFVSWDVYTRQGVYFLPEELSKASSLPFMVSFHPESGSVKFNFKTDCPLSKCVSFPPA